MFMLNKHYLKYFTLILGFYTFGCSVPNSDSLLSKRPLSYCATDPTQPGCSTAGTGSSSGALEIFTGQSNLTAAINNSDTIEITGSCIDQGKFNNRIIVQVFADEDENQVPYINNENSLFCQSSSNPVQSGLEANTADQCLYVTRGLGVVEGAGLSQKIFPQCINGQYGFSVRLGKVLADSGKPYKKYLVRFKLRAIEPAPALPTDSEWMRVVVDRPLEKPSLFPQAINAIGNSGEPLGCQIQGKASRTNLNIYYSLVRTFTDPITNATSAPVAVYSNYTALNMTPNLSVYDFKDELPEGMTYSYQITSTEGQYSYSVGNTPTEVSQKLNCVLTSPTITATSSPTANTCYFKVDKPNTSGNVVYEFGYRTDSLGWPSNTPNAYFINANCPVGSAVCTMTGLAANTYHYVSVRARNNGLGIVGKWSSAITCKTP